MKRPPLPLNRSAVILRDDLNLAGGGEVLRVCAGVAHLYETVPGWCQCGERWWDGFEGTAQRRFWHRWLTPRVSNQDERAAMSSCRVCQATVANGGRENLHYRPVLSARVSPREIVHWVNNMGVTLCGKDGHRWPEVPNTGSERDK